MNKRAMMMIISMTLHCKVVACDILTSFDLHPLSHDVIAHLLDVCYSRTEAEAPEEVECIHRCDSVARLEILKDSLRL